MIVTVIISALQAQHEDVDGGSCGRSGPRTQCFLSGVITRRERFIALGCGECSGHTRAFNIVIVSLGTWVNSGEWGRGGDVTHCLQGITFHSSVSEVATKSYPHAWPRRITVPWHWFCSRSFIHPSTHLYRGARWSRSNRPSGVANSRFLFLEVVVMCLPVKKLNQKVMNRLEWHLEGTDEYFWW